MPAEENMIIHILDIIGAVGAFIATIAYIRVSLWAWPISLLAIFVDIFLYYQQGIYGDMSLQLVYLAFTIYGWYQWKFGGKEQQGLPITSITLKQVLLLTAIAVLSIYVMFIILTNYTDSHVPFWDAATTILSLIAQWMVCRKIIENWILWFVIDGAYAVLYFYKNIPAHSLLQLVYLGMAIVGYIYWLKGICRERNSGILDNCS